MNRVLNITGKPKPPASYYTRSRATSRASNGSRATSRASNGSRNRRLSRSKARYANRAAIAQEEILRQLTAVADSSKENLEKRVVASSAAALMTERSIKRVTNDLEKEKERFNRRFYSSRPPTLEELTEFKSQMENRERVPQSLRKSTEIQKRRTLNRIANYYRHGSENVELMVEEQARKASKARAIANRLRESSKSTGAREWRNINLQEEPFFKSFENVILAVATAMDNANLINLNTTTPKKITDALAKKDAEHAYKMAEILVEEAKELFKADRSPASFHKLKFAENIRNEISAASRAISKLDAWSNLLIMFFKMSGSD